MATVHPPRRDYAIGAAVPLLFAVLLGLVVTNQAPEANAVAQALFWGLIFIGASQLVVVVPLALWAHVAKRRGVLVGLGIGALLVALVNVTCFAVFRATFL